MNFITDAAGMKIQQISFDKGAPRYGALLGGQVDALFEQPGDVRNFLDAKQFNQSLQSLMNGRARLPIHQLTVKLGWILTRCCVSVASMSMPMLQLTVLNG